MLTVTKTEVYIERMYEDVILPTYANDGDAGMDIRYYGPTTGLMPGQTELFHTGIKVAIPNGYEIQVRPRSGKSLKTYFRVANAPGTIDSGYRDEICIIGTNADCSENPKALEIASGERIAQLVLKKVPKIDWLEINDVSKVGENRDGGFGSTGTQ